MSEPNSRGSCFSCSKLLSMMRSPFCSVCYGATQTALDSRYHSADGLDLEEHHIEQAKATLGS